MNTSTSLLEKQKSRLNLILNWSQQIDYINRSPNLSAFDSDSSSSISLLDCHIGHINNTTKSISLSPSFSVEFNNNSTYFDSLNDILIDKVYDFV